MRVAKLFTVTYLLGAALFAFAFIVILLALVGVHITGSKIDVTLPVIGGFVLMVGSKFAYAASVRKAETS